MNQHVRIRPQLMLAASVCSVARRAARCATRGLGLTDSDRGRIGKELTNGKVAVDVLTPFNERR